MNFLPGKVNGTDRIALDGGGEARGVKATTGANRAITVGIRPEHLLPCSVNDAFLSGTLEMVERLGADSLLHVAHGGNTIIARVQHGIHPAIGTTLSLGADPRHVYLFDAQNGARISS
jgi:sn-glycerol 3-phosphate transport system ATP-binding protein